MSFSSIGDLAQSFQMRRSNVVLQQRLSVLSEELTGGRKADVASAVSNDFSALAGYERSLKTLASYRMAAAEAATFVQSMQLSLETAQNALSEAAPGLLSATTTSDPVLVGAVTADAKQKFLATVSVLNTQIGGRYLFSGAATDQRPLITGQDMLGALSLATAGQATVGGYVAAVDAWFDAPAGGGGYLDMAYGGSAQTLAPMRIGSGEEVSVTLTAADPQIREMLKGLALASLVSEGALAGDVQGRAQLTRTAGQIAMSSDGALAGLRANVGVWQAHIDLVETRNASEASSVELARNGIVAADPYETASALEELQTRLETLYALTARLSRLSLADYLR
jgi:flagellar hook-associated protein 3 FlgL